MDMQELRDRIRGCGVNLMWFTGSWLNQLVDRGYKSIFFFGGIVGGRG